MFFNQEHPNIPAQLSSSTDNIVSMGLQEMLQVSPVREITLIKKNNLHYLTRQLKHGLQLLQWKKENNKNQQINSCKPTQQVRREHFCLAPD